MKLPIVKKIPSVHKVENRYTIKIKSFGGIYQKKYSKNVKESKIEKKFKNFLIQLIKSKKRFQILNNQQEDLIPSDALLFGEVRIRKAGTEILTRLIDIRTKRVMKVGIIKDVYSPSNKPLLLKTLAKRLSDNIHKEFPCAIGNIIETNENVFTVYLDNKNIKMYWPLIIYREIEPDNILGSESKIIGYGYINELKRDNRYGIYMKQIFKKNFRYLTATK